MRFRSYFEVVGLFCLSLILFTWGLCTQEITAFDSRFYLFAREMWQNGLSWFPTAYDEPYPDYSAASTILIYFAATCFGGLNKFTVVLPSALAASVTVVITYMLGALHNKRWGVAAVCILLLTMTFFKSARSISLDMYPTMITACCFYLVYSADLLHRTKRYWWIFPLMVVSFIFRGPIGLVMPAGVVCIYYLMQGNFKRFFVSGFIALGLLIACCWVLLLLAYHAGGQGFMQDVLRMQIVGRLGEQYQPVYFYLTSGMLNYALGFPLAVMVVVGLGFFPHRCPLPQRPSAGLADFNGRERESVARFVLLLAGWALVILIGMSIPGEKKTRYILPMVPALALIASYPYLKYVSIRRVSIPIIAATLFAIAMITIVEPLEMQLEGSREFVTKIEAKRKLAMASLVFYKEHPDGLPIKYLVNMPRLQQPIFINNEKDLQAFTAPAFFITSESYFLALPDDYLRQVKVIAKDRIGHVVVVVFVKHN